jgi:hypothetical protein
VYASRFQDYDDMLEDTWQTSDSLYPSGNGGFGMWDSYPIFSTRLKKFDNIGLVDAIISSVLLTGIFFLNSLVPAYLKTLSFSNKYLLQDVLIFKGSCSVAFNWYGVRDVFFFLKYIYCCMTGEDG